MNGLDIKRHSFDLAKKRLKEFSEKDEAELAIDRVATDGGLCGLIDYKVTGYELNNRLESIQGHLIDINSTNNQTIKEFREVYNALDALDKDYITSIVASVKAIEKTSNDVRQQQETLKQHNDKLSNQQNKLDFHQVEIDKNVDNMKKMVATLKSLKSFKKKLDGYKHLIDIDKIWFDYKTIRNDIQVFSDSITALSTKTTNDIATANLRNKNLLEQVNKEILTIQKEAKKYMDFFSDLSERLDATANRLDEQIIIIEQISDFVSRANSISHLYDVDSIWEDISNAKESIGGIDNELQTVNDNINQMENHFDQVDEFIATINNYTHLKDIDCIWKDLTTVRTEILDLFRSVDDGNKVLRDHQSNLERLNYSNKQHHDELDTLSKSQNETKEYAEINRSSIVELQAFENDVKSIGHIADVDSMWEQGNEVKADLAEANSHIGGLQDKITEIDKKIVDKADEMQDQVESLVRKLKYAYYIAGGALCLAVVELILALTGVI